MQQNRLNTQQASLQKTISSIYQKQPQKLNINMRCSQWRNIIQYRIGLRCVVYLYVLGDDELGQCGINQSDAKMLGNMKWPNLKQLQIGKNNISATSTKYILTQQFPKLESLFIYHNYIGDEGMKIVSITHNLPQLRKLIVGKNNITGLGLVLLPETSLRLLKGLFIWKNEIGTLGAKMLSKTEFPHLNEINLHDCQFGDEGARFLSKLQWPQLQCLTIYDNRIKIDGCQAIARARINELKNIVVCWANDKMGPIAVLSLVATSWSYNNTKVEFSFYSQISEFIKNIMWDRFAQI